MVSNHRDSWGALWGELGRVRDEFEKTFRRWSDAPAAPVSSLSLNVWEDADAYVVEADLPGVDPAQVDVEVNEGKVLVIKGERAPAASEGKTAYRAERFHGKFHRELTLPTPVDAARVEAEYAHGVLRVTLPKSEGAKPRKVVVKG